MSVLNEADEIHWGPIEVVSTLGTWTFAAGSKATVGHVVFANRVFTFSTTDKNGTVHAADEFTRYTKAMVKVGGVEYNATTVQVTHGAAKMHVTVDRHYTTALNAGDDVELSLEGVKSVDAVYMGDVKVWPKARFTVKLTTQYGGVALVGAWPDDELLTTGGDAEVVVTDPDGWLPRIENFGSGLRSLNVVLGDGKTVSVSFTDHKVVLTDLASYIGVPIPGTITLQSMGTFVMATMHLVAMPLKASWPLIGQWEVAAAGVNNPGPGLMSWNPPTAMAQLHLAGSLHVNPVDKRGVDFTQVLAGRTEAEAVSAGVGHNNVVVLPAATLRGLTSSRFLVQLTDTSEQATTVVAELVVGEDRWLRISEPPVAP